MQKIVAVTMVMVVVFGLCAPGIAGCETKTTEKRKVRPQPVWSHDTSKPGKKSKKPKYRITIRPTKTPPCSPGDKRIMCPR